MVDGWNIDTNDDKVTYRYYVNGSIHREDGPAVITENGYGKVIYNSYYFKGAWHREDGFAREWISDDGVVIGSYYLNDTKADENQEILIKLNILLK